MFFENRKRFLLWSIPLCIAIAIYPVSFNGKQLISIDAPLRETFDVLVNHLWQFHPFVVQIDKLQTINETCSFYKITDRLVVMAWWNVSLTSSYYVYLNVNRTSSCLTSEVSTSWYIMNAHHQYCLHTNTLKTTTTIITDQFHGQSWMIFSSYVRKQMLHSHKTTLDRLKTEMLIFSTD